MTLTLDIPPGDSQRTNSVTAQGVSNIIATFVVPGDPASKARARFTKHGAKTFAYTPENVKVGEAKIAAAFLKATGNVRGADKEATYGVSCHFYNATRQRRDVDNMVKLVLDGLNGVAFPDDNQVTEIRAAKEYAGPETARTEVTVYATGQLDRLWNTCEHCGTKYVTYRSVQDRVRYCSPECRIAAKSERRSNLIETDCEFCGQGFSREARPGRRPRFCSRKCAAEAGRIDVTCIVCGTVARKRKSSTNRFCSEACAHRWARAEQKKLGKGAGSCQTCGGPVTRKEYRQCRPCRLSSPLPNKVSRRGNPKLTDNQVRLIRAAYASGQTTRSVAIEYGLALSTVQRIVRGQTYAHVR